MPTAGHIAQDLAPDAQRGLQSLVKAYGPRIVALHDCSLLVRIEGDTHRLLVGLVVAARLCVIQEGLCVVDSGVQP